MCAWFCVCAALYSPLIVGSGPSVVGWCTPQALFNCVDAKAALQETIGQQITKWCERYKNGHVIVLCGEQSIAFGAADDANTDDTPTGMVSVETAKRAVALIASQHCEDRPVYYSFITPDCDAALVQPGQVVPFSFKSEMTCARVRACVRVLTTVPVLTHAQAYWIPCVAGRVPPPTARPHHLHHGRQQQGQ